MSRGGREVWPPFVWGSLGSAVAAGFGLGGALFAAVALRVPLGAWWPAAAQAHGHAQLFGWAGLMVLGVGFHLLPRLASAPPPPPAPTRLVFGLLVVGLLLRTIAQPALAGGDGAAAAWRAGLIGSGIAELVGASLALVLLGRTLRWDPTRRWRADVWAVVPFFPVAFVAFWLALGANLVGVVAAATGRGLVPGRLDGLVVGLALHGFLVPIAVAMSARLFPLSLRTPPAKTRWLRVGLACSLAGSALRIGGEVGGVPRLAGIGRLGQAAALAAFVLALGVFARRRPLPRRAVRPLTDPTQLLVLSAYLWLTATAALLAGSGLAAVGVGAVDAAVDAERHALGAGFVTLLILGVGAHLLPGFAGRPLRSRRLVWLTLALGNAAALLRVGPLLLPVALPAAQADWASAAAGGAGLAAVVAFGRNLTGAPTRIVSRLV